MKVTAFNLLPMYYSQSGNISRISILGIGVSFVPAFDGHTPATRVSLILTSTHDEYTLRPMLRRLRSVRRIVDISSVCQW